MYEQLKFYLNQLSDKRFDIYTKDWWTTGCVIYNVTNGTNEGLELWQFHSAKGFDCSMVETAKKWLTFKKHVRLYAVRQLIPMIYEDGGTLYNPKPEQKMIKEVRDFVNNILVPKLSIRRTRNMVALGNLCSAIYTMSEGEDEQAMLAVSKRVKDIFLKSYFINLWKKPRAFRFTCDINSIISWYNNDEKEKPRPRATDVSYFTDDWISKTTLKLKYYDQLGFTPRYFKAVSKEEKEKAKKTGDEREKLSMLLKNNADIALTKMFQHK